MTPEDFSAFVDYVKQKHGWSKAELAERLGCGINQIARWRRRESPKYIGLACQSIVLRRGEWKPPESSN